MISLVNTKKVNKIKLNFLQQNTVDEILNDIAYFQLIGRHHLFDAFAFAATTVENFQTLNQLKPKLNFKPIEISQTHIRSNHSMSSIIKSFSNNISSCIQLFSGKQV